MNNVSERQTIDIPMLDSIASLLLVLGTLAVFQWSSQGIFYAGGLMLAAGVLLALAVQVMAGAGWRKVVERILVFMMGGGILGMFQPWVIGLYQYGFIVLGLGTIGFIIFTHLPQAPEGV